MRLTNRVEIDNILSMKGTISTKEKCPRCEMKFTEISYLHCPTCLTVPKKFFIDIHAPGGFGRIKVYSDKQGHPLDSWQRASRLLESMRYEIDQHTFDPTKYKATDINNYLFETQIESWYHSKTILAEKEILAHSYTRKLRQYINDFYIPFFRGMDVRDIRTYHIQHFYESLNKGHKTIKNILNALENFFKTLVSYEYINKQPSFPKITVEEKPPKWINLATQIKALEAVSELDRPIVTFLAFQGVRPAEGRALMVKDINFDEGFLDIARTYSDNKIRERVKSKKQRRRLINPALVPMLKTLCKQKFPESFVFINPRTGTPYSESALFRIWDSVRKKIGVDVNLYQATRHSVASIAASDGTSLQAIQNVLGHTDIRTTLKYAHADLSSQGVVFKNHTDIIMLSPNSTPDITSPVRPQELKSYK